MKDATCPYCGAEVEINHDDGYGYEESDQHQQECECGKTFTYFTAIHFTYRTYKADCLNGGEHDYRKTDTYPPEFARMRCKECGDEKPLPANDLGNRLAATGDREGEAMEFHLYTCRHCGFETYYLKAMLQHQAERHPKPVTPNAELTSRRAGD